MYIWYTAQTNHCELRYSPYYGTINSPSDCEWMIPGTVDPTED